MDAIFQAILTGLKGKIALAVLYPLAVTLFVLCGVFYTQNAGLRYDLDQMTRKSIQLEAALQLSESAVSDAIQNADIIQKQCEALLKHERNKPIRRPDDGAEVDDALINSIFNRMRNPNEDNIPASGNADGNDTKPAPPRDCSGYYPPAKRR